MNYVFRGPGPVVDPVLGLVRPNDVRQFDEEPDCPPWQLLSEAIAEASQPVLDAIAVADRTGIPVEEVLMAAPAPFAAPAVTDPKGM